MSRTYNKENCAYKVRKVTKLSNTIIIVMGRHAFEYKVLLQKVAGQIMSWSYPNRTEAMKQHDALKKLYSH